MFFGQFKRIEIDVQVKTFMHMSTNLKWNISFSLVSASRSPIKDIYAQKNTKE